MYEIDVYQNDVVKENNCEDRKTFFSVVGNDNFKQLGMRNFKLDFNSFCSALQQYCRWFSILIFGAKK